ncbi:MAG: ornithine cyclodeaminase family protein [Alphaproteobacteria bacterium]
MVRRSADPGDFIYLGEETLSGLGITTGETVAALEAALLAQRRRQVWVAPKSAVEPGDGRYFMTTLGVSETPAVMVVKAVAVNPQNPGRGLAAINGAIMLLDSDTGELRAVMGAKWITAVRTAGLSALAARRMANPQASSVAFIGSGVQALSHLDAFADLFPLKEMSVFARGRTNIEKLCAAAAEKGLRTRVARDGREAVAEADLIVSSIVATYRGPPFMDARWLKPGAFATITDLARPWEREGMETFGTIVIDDLEQEAAMPEQMIATDLVSGDLRGLVGGDVAAGHDPQKPSAFVFRGIAIGDLAVALLAYTRAVAGAVDG